jgi:hypothetical protein
MIGGKWLLAKADGFATLAFKGFNSSSLDLCAASSPLPLHGLHKVQPAIPGQPPVPPHIPRTFLHHLSATRLR